MIRPVRRLRIPFHEHWQFVPFPEWHCLYETLISTFLVFRVRNVMVAIAVVLCLANSVTNVCSKRLLLEMSVDCICSEVLTVNNF